MKRDKILYITLITFSIFICAVGYSNYLEKDTNNYEFKSNNKEKNVEENESKESNNEVYSKKSSKNNEVVVYIIGEVNEPDVYAVPEGSRIADVIEIAGGATENANLENINLAKIVRDEDKIRVPKYGEEIEAEEAAVQNSESEKIKIVNINKASKEELKTLPYIGDVVADKIIDYRNENGGFKRKEELKNVSRIGDKLYAEIEDYICIN